MKCIDRRTFNKGLLSAAVLGTTGLETSCTHLSHASGKAKKGPPNILILFSDQHNSGVMSCEGHPEVRTPHLDRLAQGGVRFDRAYCQDGVCSPSRASMMMGQYCRTIGGLFNNEIVTNPERLRTLPAEFQARGYLTGAIGKRHMLPGTDGGYDWTATHFEMGSLDMPSDESYYDWVTKRGQFREFARDHAAEHGGFQGFSSAPLSARLSDLKPENTMSAYTGDKTIEFLRNAKASGKPFLCWSTFYHPHQPYTPVPEFARLYDPDKIQLPTTLREPIENLPPGMQIWRNWKDHLWCLGRAARDESLYRRYISYYYALVTEVDHHIGRILEVLKTEGLEDNTIVVYTSDHGDFVGAHGMVEKACSEHNIYEDTLRVPFIIRWPGGNLTPATRSDLVELVDLYPTLFDLAGFHPPADYPMHGRSLAPTLLKGKPVGRRFAISESWSQVTAIGERHKLGVWIREQEGGFGDMLFDRETDPLETRNLAGQPEVAEVEKEMREFLIEWSKRTPFVEPRTTKFGTPQAVHETEDAIRGKAGRPAHIGNT